MKLTRIYGKLSKSMGIVAENERGERADIGLYEFAAAQLLLRSDPAVMAAIPETSIIYKSPDGLDDAKLNLEPAKLVLTDGKWKVWWRGTETFADVTVEQCRAILEAKN